MRQWQRWGKAASASARTNHGRSACPSSPASPTPGSAHIFLQSKAPCTDSTWRPVVPAYTPPQACQRAHATSALPTADHAGGRWHSCALAPIGWRRHGDGFSGWTGSSGCVSIVWRQQQRQTADQLKMQHTQSYHALAAHPCGGSFLICFLHHPLFPSMHSFPQTMLAVLPVLPSPYTVCTTLLPTDSCVLFLPFLNPLLPPLTRFPLPFPYFTLLPF